MRITTVCQSNVDWMRQVRGSKGDVYIVTYGPNTDPDRQARFGFTCECKAFQYRKDRSKNCKHIDEVRHQHCGWGMNEDVTKILGRAKDANCPECGGPAFEAKVVTAVGEDFVEEAAKPAQDKAEPKDQDDAAQEVACPACDRKPGEPCDGGLDLHHSARYAEAKKKAASDDMDDWF